MGFVRVRPSARQSDVLPAVIASRIVIEMGVKTRSCMRMTGAG